MFLEIKHYVHFMFSPFLFYLISLVYLSIIRRAQMGSESITHSAFGLMGY